MFHWFWLRLGLLQLQGLQLLFEGLQLLLEESRGFQFLFVLFHVLLLLVLLLFQLLLLLLFQVLFWLLLFHWLLFHQRFCEFQDGWFDLLLPGLFILGGMFALLAN